MIIFWLLFLAHLLADFPLQTNTIYNLKKKNAVGVLPHVTIHIAANIIVLIPLLNLALTWVSIAILAIIHAFLDHVKITLVSSGKKDNLFYFLIDQGLHLLTIVIIAEWLSRYSHTVIKNFLFFEDPKYIILLSGFIASTFTGTVVVFYTTQDLLRLFSKNPSFVMEYPQGLRKVIGCIERLLATLFIVIGGVYCYVSILVFIPNILIKGRGEKQLITIVEAGAGLLVSVCAALLIRGWWYTR